MRPKSQKLLNAARRSQRLFLQGVLEGIQGGGQKRGVSSAAVKPQSGEKRWNLEVPLGKVRRFHIIRGNGKRCGKWQQNDGWWGEKSRATVLATARPGTRERTADVRAGGGEGRGAGTSLYSLQEAGTGDGTSAV